MNLFHAISRFPPPGALIVCTQDVHRTFGCTIWTIPVYLSGICCSIIGCAFRKVGRIKRFCAIHELGESSFMLADSYRNWVGLWQTCLPLVLDYCSLTVNGH